MPEHNEKHRMRFVTFGMAVLDEIRSPSLGIVHSFGGSGAWAMFGARCFAVPDEAHSCGWMIKTGDDFPVETEAFLREWETTLILDRKADRVATRGLLEYADTTWGPKTFKYITPNLNTTPADIAETDLLRSESYHVLGFPSMLQRFTRELVSLRQDRSIAPDPCVIWEPHPQSCDPKYMEELLKAAQLVNFFSPNHIELAKLYGANDDEWLSKAYLEGNAKDFLSRAAAMGNHGLIIIVRAGEMGSFTAMLKDPSREDDMSSCRIEWLPAFYEKGSKASSRSDVKKLIDPTGAGNAFLGAFMSAYLETKDMRESACRAVVASSFTLEQIGPPKISKTSEGQLWNGASPWARLQEFKNSI